eukprot:TRINITY_DN4033_c0_g1_i1.p1 TRINITY_DN4033_c0_g1~~TRINITY_DN4033_c0_g1_i1.p1  ORF type:complete len:178 (-),score=61.74 TRINITY_DN4033_c0_g1_i1:70-579(-)
MGSLLEWEVQDGCLENILCLVLILQVMWVRGEDELKVEKELDLAEMVKMGISLGKNVLGEEVVENLKKGDLSDLVKVGEKVLGEDTVKNLMNSATEGKPNNLERDDLKADAIQDKKEKDNTQTEGKKEMDWTEMIQMGLAVGKSILGEEVVEQLKKGDLSVLSKALDEL